MDDTDGELERLKNFLYFYCPDNLKDEFNQCLELDQRQRMKEIVEQVLNIPF